MATIKVEHETTLSKQETFNRVKKFFNENEGLKSLDGSLEISIDEPNYSGRVKGSKFDGQFKVVGDSPAKVVIEVNLSFLLTPLKGKIQDTLQKKIGQFLS